MTTSMPVPGAPRGRSPAPVAFVARVVATGEVLWEHLVLDAGHRYPLAERLEWVPLTVPPRASGPRAVPDGVASRLCVCGGRPRRTLLGDTLVCRDCGDYRPRAPGEGTAPATSAASATSAPASDGAPALTAPQALALLEAPPRP